MLQVIATAGAGTLGIRRSSPIPRDFLAELHDEGLKVTLNLHPVGTCFSIRAIMLDHLSPMSPVVRQRFSPTFAPQRSTLPVPYSQRL